MSRTRDKKKRTLYNGNYKKFLRVNSTLTIRTRFLNQTK